MNGKAPCLWSSACMYMYVTGGASHSKPGDACSLQLHKTEWAELRVYGCIVYATTATFRSSCS